MKDGQMVEVVFEDGSKFIRRLHVRMGCWDRPFVMLYSGEASKENKLSVEDVDLFVSWSNIIAMQKIDASEVKGAK